MIYFKYLVGEIYSVAVIERGFIFLNCGMPGFGLKDSGSKKTFVYFNLFCDENTFFGTALFVACNAF